MLDKIVKILLILVLGIYGLVATKNVLIPLFIAILLWFIIFEITTNIQKIKIRKYRFPRWIAYLISTVLISTVCYFIISAMVHNLKEINQLAPKYEQNIRSMTAWVNANYSIDLEVLSTGWIKSFNIKSLASSFLNQLSVLISNSFMIILYIIFLIIESEFFTPKLKKALPNKSMLLKTIVVINNIKDSMGNYIVLKTGVSLITGICSYIILLIIGVDLALFWALLIFLLNYIPSVGSLIATIFPAVVALFQFAELQPFLLVLILIGSLQLIVGNFIEPKVFGDKLNINGFVVILALAIWGAMWGIAGMALSVPITLISIAILDQFPQTKGIAVFLKS